MTRKQLEYAIRAACDVSEDTEIWVFGSQAILGEFPDAPESLRASIERDFVRVLLTEAMIVAKTLIERIHLLKIDEQLRERLVQWIQTTAEELKRKGKS